MHFGRRVSAPRWGLARHGVRHYKKAWCATGSSGGTEEGMSNPDQDGQIFVGKSEKPELLTLAFGNRHGLVTGATGTGKTVTLQTMAEGFSRAGVPVFAADIKGDLSGIAAPGDAKDAFVKRAKDIGFEYETDQFPA